MSSSGRTMRNPPRGENSERNTPFAVSPAPDFDHTTRRDATSTAEEWSEPPLRQPAPSFEDHKGLERHGVLEHMAPLGTMPKEKPKLRVKQYDPHRRANLAKQGDVVGRIIPVRRNAESTKESQPYNNSTMGDNSTIGTPQKSREEDGEYNPKLTIARSGAQRATIASRKSVPSASTIAGQEKLRKVVDAAVERSRELGNEILGLAVKQLFEESLDNRTLAELLDAVLSQRPTPRQAADFQAYIKIARKQIAAETGISRRSSLAGQTPSISHSKSPSKLLRASSTRESRHSMNNASTSITSPVRLSAKPNGNMQPEARNRKRTAKVASIEPPISHPRSAKRQKRSKPATGSISSLSSLSSIDEPEQDQEHESTDDAVTRNTSDHLFDEAGELKRPAHKDVKKSSKKSGTADASDADQEEREAAIDEHYEQSRRRLKRVADDDGPPAKLSGIRTKVMPSSRPIAGKAAGQLGEQGDNTNRSAKRQKLSEDEGSPLSSVPDEDGAPAAEASKSRGITPIGTTRLRGQKTRLARMKHSPTKKPTGGVAGNTRGVERGANGAGGEADSDDLQDKHDYCDSCTRFGIMVVCEWCPRAFHLKCLDPPLDKSPLGDYQCKACAGEEKKKQSRIAGKQPAPYLSVMDPMNEHIEFYNPVEFKLDQEIRETFENISTGEDGEYVEEITRDIKPREEVILKYEKDKNGQFPLCFSCGGLPRTDRALISCDFCDLKWHLDCLDPILTSPPLYRKKYPYKCPAHFATDPIYQKLTPGACRMVRSRRKKGAKVVDMSYMRGLKNNGMIEIVNDPDLASNEECRFDLMDAKLHTTYKIHERTIKLDFLDRARREREKVATSQEEARLRLEVQQELEAENEHYAKLDQVEKSLVEDLLHFAETPRDLELDQVKLQAQNDEKTLKRKAESLLKYFVQELPRELLDSFMAESDLMHLRKEHGSNANKWEESQPESPEQAMNDNTETSLNKLPEDIKKVIVHAEEGNETTGSKSVNSKEEERSPTNAPINDNTQLLSAKKSLLENVLPGTDKSVQNGDDLNGRRVLLYLQAQIAERLRTIAHEEKRDHEEPDRFDRTGEYD